MKIQSLSRILYLIGMVFLLVGLANAGTPASPEARQLLETYLSDVRTEKQGFPGFDAITGKELYFAERTHSKKKESRSCSVCHGDDPAGIGQHVTSGKTIEPLTPAANPERLTEAKKIEKWFRRNCKWTLERECTSEEKGHFLTFLYSR